MQKKLGVMIVLFVLVPVFFLAGCCAKKTAAVQPVVAEAPPAPAPPPAPDNTAAEAAERARMAARNQFLTENVHFDFDKSDLTPMAQGILQNKAEYLKTYPDEKVLIAGHCDERGTAEYNLALGERRAESAKAYLVELGIDPARISTISYGEEMPVDPAKTEEAYAKNRRDEFILQ